ncbi:MAG: porin family protein [Campylobacterales bacterium]|nr:porin family protein [Campylobacterales bacterium]
MKRFTLSLAAVLAMGTFAVAGGDIAPVEPMVEVEAPAPASDSGFYIGGAYSRISSSTDAHGAYGDYDGDGSYWDETADGDNDGYMLQAGYQFNKYLAVEGRYWGATAKMSWTWSYEDGPTDSWSDDCGDISAWGIYVKPMYPVTNELSVYGLLGYGNTSIGDDVYGDAKLVDESGFQWGLGLSYAYDEHISFFVDYVQLANDAEGSYDWVANGETYWDYDYIDWKTSVDTINVGVTYKF